MMDFAENKTGLSLLPSLGAMVDRDQLIPAMIDFVPSSEERGLFVALRSDH